MASKEQDTSSEGGKLLDTPNPSERSSRKRTSSTSSRRSSITTPPSSRRNSLSTPKSPVSRKSTPTPSKSGSTPGSNKKLPSRPGIIWRPGEKLEAKDFLQKWYPAKIVEIDHKEDEVLIHFEGWNSRFDEWLEMSSERLRPITRHSERKEKPVPKAKRTKYKMGDVVLAKWSDCRMYPAKVTGILHDNAYEVMYYDGIKKAIQNINIRPLPPEMQDQEFHVVPPAATVVNPLEPTLSKEDRRLLKKKERRDFTNSPGFKKKLKQEAQQQGSSYQKERRSTETKDKDEKAGKTAVKQKEHSSIKKTLKVSLKPVKTDKMTEKSKKEEKLKRREKRREERIIEKKKALKAKGQKTDYAKFLKRKKLLIGGTFQAKRKFQDVQNMRKKKMEKANLERRRKEKSDSSEEEDIDLEGEASAEGSSLETDTPPMSPQSKRMNSAVSATKKAKQAATPSPPTKDTPPETPKYPEGKLKKREFTEQKKVRRKRRVDSSPDSATKKKKLKFYAEVMVPATDPAPKEFVVKKDHNQYKCIFTDCDKSFRKQSLLDYHLKYYHTEDGTPIQPPPPRQRKKTISMCSNESEVSIMSDLPLSELVSRPGKKKRMSSADSERKRHLSAVSTDSRATVEYQDDTACLDAPEDSVHSFPADQDEFKSTEDTVDMMDIDDGQDGHDGHDGREELSDEVVNCICMLNEENGLMIQCECCMCWQHADCLNVTADTLPSKYVCSICQNPVGVRESARFIWDQDMFRTGQLSRFACNSPGDKGRKSPFMLATNNLLGDMHNVSRVLKGLKRKIKLLSSKNHPDLDLWAKELDRQRELEKEQRLEEEMQNMDEEEDDDVEEMTGRSDQEMMELLNSGKVHGGHDDLQTHVDTADKSAQKSENLSKEGSSVEFSLKEKEGESGSLGLKLDGSCTTTQVSVPTLPLPRNARNNSSLDSNEEIDVIGLSPTQKSFPSVSVPGSTGTSDAGHHVTESSILIGPMQGNEGTSSDTKTQEVKYVLTPGNQTKVSPNDTACIVKQPTDVSTSQGDTENKSTKSLVLVTKDEGGNGGPSALTLAPPGAGEYKLSPVPSRVKLIGSSVWTPVAKNLSTLDSRQPENNAEPSKDKCPPAELPGTPREESRPTADLQEAPSSEREESLKTEEEAVEDRQRVAETRLKEHINQLQDELEKNLDFIEEQVDVLEAEIIGDSSSKEDPLEDLPHLKKSLHSILYDLSKVKRMAMYH